MIYQTLIVLLTVSLVHSNVVVLDDSNYTSYTQEHPYVFVKYYAPWCGHCKSMAPDYEKLATASEGKEYMIAKVDMTENKKVAEEVKIDGFPTLRFLVNGHAIDYSGQRNFDSMNEWLQALMSSQIQKITEDKVKELIGSKDFVLVQGATQEQLKLLRFAKTTQIDFFTLEGGDFKITAYLKDSKTLEYNGEVDIKQIADWVLINTMSPLVTLSSNEAVQFVFQNKKQLPAFLLLRNNDWSDQLSEQLTQVCKQNNDKFVCAWAGDQHQIYQGVSRFLKSEGKDHSILTYFDFGLANGWKFPEPTTFTQQSILQFIEDVNAGKIEKFHDEQKQKENKQSQKQNQGKIQYQNVLKLTSQTYNSTLADNTYVLVEYYSPSCGHCINFAPKYEEFAKKMKEQNSKYIIAAVDMVGNKEINDYVSVNGYPTFRFYINGIEFDYDGQRDGDKMKEWMDKVIDAKLQKIQSLQKVQKPAVAIYGIKEDHHLQKLGIKYTRYPVYWIQSSEFKVQVLDNKFAQYTGDQNLDAVYNWLQQKTQQVLINVATTTTTRKLNRALENQTPLLLLINRDNSDGAKIAKQFLTLHCQDKIQYVCGYAQLIKDPIPEKSRMLYLTTQKFEKFLYEEQLADLNAQKVQEFIKLIKDGKINAHAAAEQAQEAPQAPEGQEPQGESPQVEIVEGQQMPQDDGPVKAPQQQLQTGQPTEL